MKKHAIERASTSSRRGKRTLVVALLAVLLVAASAAAFYAQDLWFPQVLIVERNPLEIYPPRWDLTVYPGAIEHEFLTAEELAGIVQLYCKGIDTEPHAAGR